MTSEPASLEASQPPLPARIPVGLPGNPRIIPRSEHNISRRGISEATLKVLYRLHSAGYRAFLVGGGVRDLFLGKKPKDFDVGTDARPARLKKLFRNCRIIGRRFRIAHVYFSDDEYIEVATFRRGEVLAKPKGDGVVLLDNEYGTPEEDAKRRDLTINGLFYDIETFSIIDYIGGVEDLKNSVVRTIRDPDTSFQEDPVRMIRALRHAARTNFTVEEETLNGIYRNRDEIRKANSSRLVEEFFKDLRAGASRPFFEKLVETSLVDPILPTLAEQIRTHGERHPLYRRLEALDRHRQQDREYTNAVLISVLLHTVLIPTPENWTGDAPHPAGVWPLLQRGFREVGDRLRVSRRDAERVAQILLAFRRLHGFLKHGEPSLSYQKKTYLAEAIDFLELDLESQGRDTAILDEWRRRYARTVPKAKPRLPPRPQRGKKRRDSKRPSGTDRSRDEGARTSRAETSRDGGAATSDEPRAKKKRRGARRQKRRRSQGRDSG